MKLTIQSIQNTIIFILKVSLGVIIIQYINGISNLHNVSDFFDGAVLSLFITYGSIKLTNTLFDKTFIVVKWLFKDTSGLKPFN